MTEELRLAVTQAVMRKGLELQHRRDKGLATMVANGVNGARSVDGRGGSSSSTSSTRG